MSSKKILALDYGDRYIGVAITDDNGHLALRHSVIDQDTADTWLLLKALVDAELIEEVIVGVPINLSGEATGQTKTSEIFMSQLRKRLPKVVVVRGVDETFTSKEAERIVRQEGGKVKEAHAEAARLMLEQDLNDFKRKLQKSN